jgi:ABC-type xylose transport system permease subunit
VLGPRPLTVTVRRHDNDGDLEMTTPSRAAALISFVSGAIIGLLIGLSVATTIAVEHVAGFLVTLVVTGIMAGLLAVRFGSRFWEAVGRLRWLLP